jgi:small subunit ribosomal protein S15
MFRTCISGCSFWPSFSLGFSNINLTGTRAIASASKHIHTSAVFFSQATKRTGARNKKINQNKTKRRNKVAASSRPSVVLGTRPWEEEEKWKNCRLAQVLVNEEALSGTDIVKTKLTIGEVDVPKQLGYGVDKAEQKMLLDSLPVVTAHMVTAHKLKVQQPGMVDSTEYSKDIAKHLPQTNMFAKVLDLQNANAAGIAYVNRQRIIKAFSTSKNPFDTGRTEVQGAQPDQVHQICPLLNFALLQSLF